MNEKLKRKMKTYGPILLGVVGVIVGTAVALHYRNELVKHTAIEPGKWPVIPVNPQVFEEVKNGATLKYREFWVHDGNTSDVYSQCTTLEDFPEEANAEMRELKKKEKA